MKDFAQLITKLDQTTKTSGKVEALSNFFRNASEEDKLWTIAILSHRRPKRTVNTSLLRQWAAEKAEVPLWLFEESYHVVGDLAETIALVLPENPSDTEKNLTYWVEQIIEFGALSEEEKKERVMHAWSMLDRNERFIFNKLITGGFRIGVSQKLMVRALSAATGIDEDKLAHRLMGTWTPSSTTFKELVLTGDPGEDISKPYPFYLAYALEDQPEDLGKAGDWIAERKWDGIRGQIIVRGKQVFVWSRGEELVTDRFPEYHPLVMSLPDGTVLDGEIMPWKNNQPLSFQLLQTRIGRKKITKGVLEKAPVVMIVYDLLEYYGKDIRQQPLLQRRTLLQELLDKYDTGGILMLSPEVPFSNWQSLAQERAAARKYRSEGLMLKRLHSAYQSGRKRGDWWKWKVDPLTIDGVMIYAQRGHGRRANLFTDFTFAVWDGDRLVPFTKAYSGLKDHEFQEITTWVRKHTVERFGPVRSVKPRHVFEIAFEGIQASKRHKSGVALRFPRMRRWRKDKPAEEANTLQDLQALLNIYKGDT